MTIVGDDFEQIGNNDMKTDAPSAGPGFSFLTQVDPTRDTKATADFTTTNASAAPITTHGDGVTTASPNGTKGFTQDTAITDINTLVDTRWNQLLGLVKSTGNSDAVQQISDTLSNLIQMIGTEPTGRSKTQGAKTTPKRGRKAPRKTNASTWGGRQTDGVTGKATNGGRTETITKPGQKFRKGHKNDKSRGGEKASDETPSTIILTVETDSNGQTKATTSPASKWEKSKARENQKDEWQGQNRTGWSKFGDSKDPRGSEPMTQHARAVRALQDFFTNGSVLDELQLVEVSMGSGVSARFKSRGATSNPGFKPGKGWGGRRSRKG